ncbi:MAG: pilus assembly protein PilM [PVC group bacterium]|nr:pilus assembly protein PilM [PVC group bacterium]
MKVFIGVEISEEYIKIVVSKHRGQQAKIIDAMVKPIGTLSDGDIAGAIMSFLKTNRYKPKAVAVSLARSFVTVRNLHLPSKDQSEIGGMIDLHISRIIPYKREEVVLSHHFSGVDELGYARVMLAIIHIDIITRQMRILEKTGFPVDRITLSSYGSWQWVLRSFNSEIKKTELYLILDIDATFTDFIIFDRDNLLFTRNIAIKAQELHSDLGKRKLLGEVRQSLLIFNNEEIEKKPQAIFLSGANIPRFSKIVEEELSIPVRTVSGPVSEGILKTKERRIPESISLNALSELNLKEGNVILSFILPEMQVRRSVKEKTKELVVLGSLMILSFMIISLIFWARIYNKQTYLKQLTERSILVENELGDIAEKIDRIAFTKSFLNKRCIPLFVMSRLQKVIKDSASIELISLSDNKKITLRGQAYKLSDVFALVSSLDEVEEFTEVQTRYTRERKMKNMILTDFELSLLLNL